MTIEGRPVTLRWIVFSVVVAYSLCPPQLKDKDGNILYIFAIAKKTPKSATGWSVSILSDFLSPSVAQTKNVAHEEEEQSSMAQSHKIHQGLAAQTILVSSVNSLLALVFLWDLSTIRNITKFTPLSFSYWKYSYYLLLITHKGQLAFFNPNY